MVISNVSGREKVIGMLVGFKSYNSKEKISKEEIIKFIKDNSKCFNNDFEKGHITGSAIVVDEDLEYTLLTYHPFIKRWLQFGGHSDSSPNTIAVAFREAEEESGLTSLHFLEGKESVFDVDVHKIPAKADMPEHKHYDIRILLVADMNESFTVSHESKELRWVKLEEARKYNKQPAFLRLVNKVIRLRNSSSK